ncbi:MAG TPA: hypothetical protein VKZ18_16530 [Polyangia bacterium]|nr:hypothetical protein [Polyangia bacterium]
MAKRISPRASFLCGAVLALAGVSAGCKALPSKPSYAADVLPIFQARCLRCHGDAVLPDGSVFEPAKALLPSGPAPASALVSFYVYLGRYDDSPECTADGGPNPGCQWGAKHWATTPAGANTTINMLSDVIYGGAVTTFPMPPPPAQALSDWEATVVDSWTANPIP